MPTEITVPKATGVVEIRETEGNLTLNDRRLYNHLLAIAYETLGEGQWYRAKLADVRRVAAEVRGTDMDVNNTRLKASIAALQTTLVQYNYMGSADGETWDGWGSAPLLGTARIERGDLIWSYPQGMAELLRDPALFSLISLSVQYHFSSKYSLVLYEVLQRYADRRAPQWRWTVAVEELRDLIGAAGKLSGWKALYRRALEPALEDINRYAPFSVAMTPEKVGRTISEVTFLVRRKDRSEAQGTLAEQQKPRLQRKGERAVKEQAAAKALAYLETADAPERLRWAKRAEAIGVKVPQGAIAPHQLPKWVPFIADVIVAEERL